jgi:hypothetical protein
LAKPLYEATKVGEWEPIIWGEEQEEAFKEIRRALTNALALGFPDVLKALSYIYMRDWGQL